MDAKYSKLLYILEANTHWPTKGIYPVSILFGSVLEASPADILTTHTRMDFSPQGFTGTSQFSLQVSKDLSASQWKFSHVPPVEIKFSSSFLLCERNQPISHFPWHNLISSLLLLSSCQAFPTSSSCVLLYLVNHHVNANTGAWWFHYELTKSKTCHLQIRNGDVGMLWFFQKSE